MLEKYVLTILESIWNHRLRHIKTKLKICHHMLKSSTQPQNRSFHVMERTTTSSKRQKMKKHVQSVQKYYFSLSNMQICGVFVAVVVVVTLNLPYVKERCTLMRAARAARLFFSPSTNHIIDLLRRRYTCSTIIFSRSTNSVSLIYGVFVAVGVVASQTPY